MRKKLIIKGPLLSRSGYGEQSRFALDAIRSRPELFDIYILNIPWGQTGEITTTDERTTFIKESMLRAAEYIGNGGQFDVSLQITVPNEFERMAPINVGYTAGIETTKVAPEWIQKINETMNKVITISNHSKKVFENTKYDVKDQMGNEVKGWGLTVPVDYVNYPIRYHEPDEEVAINFETEKNFLLVSQWGPRKNVDNSITWFIEQFKDNPDVGLVLKTNLASDSNVDRFVTEGKLKAILRQHPDRKCKIYMVHGTLTPNQLAWLYAHPTMMGMIHIAHGEGFGLPLYEAACHGLPLITVTWSGQMDFICKPNKKGKLVPHVVKVDYDLREVQQEAVWPGVIQADSKWSYARGSSFKRALEECMEKQKHHRTRAEHLRKYIMENFSHEKQNEKFVSNMKVWADEDLNVEEWLSGFDVEDHE
tara:strand:+ start:7782 stop:9047 length:1266 start_codon:yes stop_codon:yes gene_type:complete